MQRIKTPNVLDENFRYIYVFISYFRRVVVQKPDGLTIIQQHELPAVLYPLKLEDFVGIGPRMLRRLNKAGICSVEQLFAQSDGQLRQVWGGVVGARLFRLIRGEDLPGPIIQRKSVGHSYVLPPDLRTVDGARSALMPFGRQGCCGRERGTSLISYKSR